MSLDANEYLVVPEGGIPEIVPPPQMIGESVSLPFDRYIIELRVQCCNTAAGVRFLEWLRDKIRADQEAAKAFAVVDLSRLTADDLVGLGKPGRVERMPVHPGSSAAPLPELPTTISGRAIITEGDTAPSADVHAIKPSPRGAP